MQADDRVSRVLAELAGYAHGVHQLGAAARRGQLAPIAELPPGAREFYEQHNGAALFHESLELLPVEGMRRIGDRWEIGALERDVLLLDDAGCVWRADDDSGDLIHEGTRFDRWLDGYVAGEAILYDRDGEFRDFVFEGEVDELTPKAAVDRARAAHRRDRHAAGPRWRLARALARRGDLAAARDELEELVADHPAFAWGWYDLARIAETIGDLPAACDDAQAAAEADPTYPHVGYFWAYAARLAGDLDDDPRRRSLAERALAAAPGLARDQRAAAAASREVGELDSAWECIRIARALDPLDIETLDLYRRIASERAASAEQT